MSPYAYPPRPPNAAYPGGVYPTGNDTKAVISLVLGILSIVCCFGILTGIPAIILGVLARRDIARSQGALGGEGMAIGGIVTGGIAVVGSLLYFIFYVGIIGTAIATSPVPAPPPPYMPPPTYTPYGLGTGTTTVAPTATGLPPVPPVAGSISIHDVHRSGGSTLHSAIALEMGEAKDDGAKLLVVAVSPTCAACDELFGELFDPALQKALDNVNILRVDTIEWKTDLPGLGMDKKGVPWFYRFDDSMKLLGAISADEWSDNTADNIAPVLGSFMKGTYKKKTGVSPGGDAGSGLLFAPKKDAGHDVF
ncbi:hypothetical protein BH09MYX1_BH09MYX1_63600 [soil metagenome]